MTSAEHTDPKEVASAAYLLEQGYGFSQYELLFCWRSDSYGEEGIEYVVQYGLDPNHREWRYNTAKEAAEQFIKLRREHNV